MINNYPYTDFHELNLDTVFRICQDANDHSKKAEKTAADAKKIADIAKEVADISAAAVHVIEGVADQAVGIANGALTVAQDATTAANEATTTAHDAINLIDTSVEPALQRLDDRAYMIDSSINGTGWSYVKYSNGYQKAWYCPSSTVSQQCSTSFGTNAYYGTMVMSDLPPLNWDGHPSIQATAECSNAMMDMTAKTVTINSAGAFTALQIYVHTTKSGTYNIKPMLVIEGKAK